MTPLADHEESTYQGKPVECYRFSTGAEVWRHTSADVRVVLPAGTFDPASISRSGTGYSEEENSQTIEIEVPRNHPVAALFVGYPPSIPVGVIVYRAHRQELDSFVPYWTGKVISSRTLGSSAFLLCGSLLHSLKRRVPVLSYQTPCGLILYGAECGANSTAHRTLVTITTVNGRTLTSADFDALPDGSLDGGTIVAPDGTPRFVTSHVGDTVQVIARFPNLVSLDVVEAFDGCDRLEPTCSGKFGRLDSHMGFSRFPLRNPFDGRVD